MALSTVYAEEVKRVRALGLETAEIAQATGTAPGTVSAWARASRRPNGTHKERLLELVALVERLQQVMEPAYVPLWLMKPNPSLGDRRPLELIAGGRYRQLSRFVAELENDSFS